MSAPKLIGRWALGSLLLALGIALVGLWLRQSERAPFWGGLLLAFGEAALVGGLADWFAVRALFARPLGLPFPHVALIPRNRARITRAVRQLIEQEWLPQDFLAAKLEGFDFAGQLVVPALDAIRPHLRELLRQTARDLLERASPGEGADLLTRGLGGALTEEKVGPFLAGLVNRARENRWMQPVLTEWALRLQRWAGSPACHSAIRGRLERAALSYQETSPARSILFSIAELFGSIDLDQATDALQAELSRFAEDQLKIDGPLQRTVSDSLAGIEHRLLRDPNYLHDLRAAVLDTTRSEMLGGLLAQVLASLKQEGLRELEREDSKLADWAAEALDAMLQRLRDDRALADRLNPWCRRVAVQLLDRHHAVIGNLVEEQLGRLSDERLTQLIEDRVGEDLNWIRLNGTFVGGLIGVGLYLLFRLVGG
jgi:uncharacterized membrane-anchored protein YjiN (DUF445 family)